MTTTIRDTASELSGWRGFEGDQWRDQIDVAASLPRTPARTPGTGASSQAPQNARRRCGSG
jgi:hypothetical protein